MDNFELQTIWYIEQRQMIKNGDTVIVGLSGGGDSMALFRFFLSAGKELGICLRAAHVNHGLRGKAADADEEFVRGYCDKCKIPLDVIRLRSPENAGEEWARNERYLFFRHLSEKYGALIATAHNACDNAETVLFNLARGSAARGVSGIPPVRLPYIRPILWADKKNILDYLEKNKVPYVTDETNGTERYSRNKIRHNVLPALESAHSGAMKNITRFSCEMEKIADYLDEQARKLLAAAKLGQNYCSEEQTPEYYSVCILKQAPDVVRHAALAQLIASAAPQQKMSLVPLAEELLFQEKAAQQLCKGVYLVNEQGRLFLQKEKEKDEDFPECWKYPLSEGIFQAPNGKSYEIIIKNYEKSMNSKKDHEKHLNLCIDYDKIKGKPYFRTKCAGDQFRPYGRGITKLLKDYFSEQKVPSEIRKLLPVLACENKVLWVAGFGFADGLAPDLNTKITVTILPR